MTPTEQHIKEIDRRLRRELKAQDDAARASAATIEPNHLHGGELPPPR